MIKFKKRIVIMSFAFAFIGGTTYLANNTQDVRAAATITVNSTSDSSANDGVCTLREAITAANSDIASGLAAGECVAGSGADTIEFDLAGPSYTFTPATPYDNITESVTINGYSQTGAAENTADMEHAFNGTILIEIDGSLQGDDTTVLNLFAASTIRGLSIHSATGTTFGNAIFTDDTADSSVIAGNFLGVEPDGTTQAPNAKAGVQVDNASTDVVIGGTNAADRNIISGNDGSAVSLTGSRTIVQGNFIGTDITGTSVLSNGSGIVSYSSDGNIIGGTTLAERNIISGTTNNPGILVSGVNNTIQGNYIGVDINGDAVPGFENPSGGIALIPLGTPSSNNLIGGAESGAGNLVRNNGIGVAAIEFAGNEVLNNSILGNSIYENSGSPISELGIDLSSTANFAVFTEAGVTANDAGDPDTGPNDYLNFPVLNSTSATAGTLDVNFDLDIPDVNAGVTGYRVEFFANSVADASGNGEGEIYLGSANVTGDVTGETATLSIPQSFTSGSYSITATTTEIDGSTDGFGATSEFAENLDGQTVIAAAATTTDTTTTTAEDTLANTGQNMHVYFALAGALLISSLVYLRKRLAHK